MSSLKALSAMIDALNERIGRGVAWLTLLMVLMQFFVVIFRYVFSVSFIPLQESIWYLHGMIFMLGAGYTLLHNEHVRVDVFYRDAKPKTKALIDILGSLIYLIPICILIFVYSYGYVSNSWAVFEGSTETNGLHLKFLLKTVIWIFCLLMALQGVSMAIKGFLYRHDQGTHYDDLAEDEFLTEEYKAELAEGDHLS
ncbi:MAG: TRAP transporter small permease subunit [Alphaproteobacteria bacterium]|nr:TRAP transporter small permease subunit [Alphaproteobacteria bacterium]